MIKENQRFFNQLHLLSDGGLVFAAVFLAHWCRFELFNGIPTFPLSSYVWLALAAAVLCLCVYGAMGLYDSYRIVRLDREASRLLAGTLLVTLILVTSLFVFRITEMSRWLLVFFCAWAYVLLMIKRIILRKSLQYYRRRGYNQKYVLVVGDGPMAKKYVNTIRNDPNLGFSVTGYVADGSAWRDV